VSGSIASAAQPHAGDDFNQDTRRAASLNLFAATPEDKWIAALKPDNEIACPRFGHKDRIDPLLRHRVTAALFGDRDIARRWIGERNDCWIN
jgi:hypothetical protein